MYLFMKRHNFFGICHFLHQVCPRYGIFFWIHMCKNLIRGQNWYQDLLHKMSSYIAELKSGAEGDVSQS